MQDFTNSTLNGATSGSVSNGIYSVEETGAILHLKKSVKGEWRGPNPTGEGASEDGFILYAAGNAFDRKLDRRYSSPEVAKMAGIKPEQYAPCATHFAQNGDSRPAFSSGHTNGHPAILEAIIPPQSTPKAKEKASKPRDSRTMEDRGIKPETLETFGFKFNPALRQYRYPTFTATGEPGRERWKNLSADQLKYVWKKGDTRPNGEVFGLKQLLEINPYPVEVWVVGGEIDVLTCFEAGILAVATFGEMQGIETLIEALETVGVERLNVALDNDETGQNGAAKVFEVAKSRDIEPTLYALGGKDGHDINDVWNDSKGDAEIFKQALLLAKVEAKPKTEKAEEEPFEFSTDADLDSRLGAVEWVWPGYIPRGFVTGLVAEQDGGKSTVAQDFCRTLLIGGLWPDGTRCELKADHLFWIDTDGNLALFHQRLKAWKMPRGKFIFPPDSLQELTIDDAKSWAWIERVIEKFAPPLVVIDALSGSHRGKSNDEDSMKVIMKRLHSLAQKHKIAIVVIHHLNKAPFGVPPYPIHIDRLRGSGSIPQFCRSILALTAPDTFNPDARRLDVIKLNIAKKPPAVGYSLTDNGPAWGRAPEPPKEHRAADDAADFLSRALANGKRPAKEVRDEAVSEGLSDYALKQARKQLGVEAIKSQTPNGGWDWKIDQKKGFES
ncbi:Toprim-like [Abditibacterium utsteinense]|uniref:Toprim-like n=1 Tax=Abditibacterium utsteinense TaxID=1960156 RepID=A0A2S8SNQ2_9BACT|nr:AAA family ATPase [Abditibacterium utsteinense]PQV62423.1 Toprim-like [Abditibacterium utsteinense]